ncbi:MAG TPA: isochorismatase family protein [Deltaproteobacteria bacterium]|nr:isochorismatase family protein [Deltaproteobacteria bacterium]HPR54322.1 isochorismatase family protein [Deltaproteobacteria bacterium]HXK47623.1 isochorismatase family protein [Deltaproteobacteria bacterium]
MKTLWTEQGRADAARAHRYILKPEDTLLLAIDVQEWLFAKMETFSSKAFCGNVRIMARISRALHLPSMVSEHFPERFGTTIGELDDLLTDARKITKLSGSCWREGQIRAGIKASDRKTVLVVGMEAHLAVLRTVMDLLQTGYNPVVIADAVCSRTAALTETALNAMALAGAVVYPAETAACMLLDGTDPELLDEIMSLSYGALPPLPSTRKAMNR